VIRNLLTQTSPSEVALQRDEGGLLTSKGFVRQSPTG